MTVAGLDRDDAGKPAPEGYGLDSWAAFLFEGQLVETVIRSIWAGQCPLCIVDDTIFCDHGPPDQGCLRCGQPWELHPRTTGGVPSSFPTDCP